MWARKTSAQVRDIPVSESNNISKTIADAMLFLKIDAIGVITAISSVKAIQTSIRDGETTKRDITLCVPRLALPFSIIYALIVCCCIMCCNSKMHLINIGSTFYICVAAVVC